MSREKGKDGPDHASPEKDASAGFSENGLRNSIQCLPEFHTIDSHDMSRYFHELFTSKLLLDFAVYSLFIPPMFLIISGGDAPNNELIRERASRAEKIIAADKGARYCLKAGIVPDIVVGDMDSIAADDLERLYENNVELMKYSHDKDQTDTQLALDLALKDGADEVEILAACGNRFDHCLANVHLLQHALDHGIQACILTSSQRIFLIDSEYTLRGLKGQTVSLLPLTMTVQGICLEGFKYNLENASMKIGNPIGISNIITSDESRISLGEGVLIITVSTTV
jgi:thiamine pyrophosphokinase